MLRRFQKVLERIRCQNQNPKRPFLYYTGSPPLPRWPVSFFGHRRVEARSVVSRNAPITYALRIMPTQPRTAYHVRAYVRGHTSAYRSAPITSALACPPDLPTRPRAVSRLARPRRT